MERDIVKRIEDLMDLFDEGEVTTADKIDRPQSSLDREAYDDFNKRNPMAGGGRIGFGDGSVTAIKQGKNKGKFHLRLGSGKNRKTYIGTEEELNKIFENRRTAGGDTTIGLEKKKYKKNFLPRNKFLKFLKDNNIKAENASNFAERYGIKREPNPFNKNQFIYSTEQFNKNFIDDIMKRQVATGQATDFAKKKFPVKTKSELQKPRLKAIKAKGGIQKNDPFSAPRGSGAQLGHTGNIFGTELITGDRLAYTPSEVNELMSRKGNLDDKIRTVSAKIENIKKSNKSPKVKKDLLEQADNILIRLASQSQGFKKVTLSDGGTFGGDRLTIDPFDIYKGKTEKEIVQLQKQYLNKPIITEEMAAKNPNLKVTPPEEIAKIQDAYFFEENRKASLKAAQKFPKQELNNLLSELAANIDPDGCGRKASASGGRIGLQFGSTPCALKAKKRLDQIVLRGTKDKSEQLLANKILTAGRSLKDFASIRGTLGPAALAFTAATEAGLVGYDMLAEGKTFKEAVGDSVFNYALGPKLKIDSVQERNKRFRKLGVSEEDMGKIGAYESALQDIEQFDKTFEEAQTAQQRLDEATDAIDPTLFPGTIDELQKNLNVARANVQDLYRAGDPYQRLTPAIEPTGLAALQEAQKLATVDRLTSAGPKFLGKVFPKYEESRQQRILDASSFINPADKLLTDVGISYLAEGGLSGGDKSGPPPERGPNPQGLLSLKNRVRNL